MRGMFLCLSVVLFPVLSACNVKPSLPKPVQLATIHPHIWPKQSTTLMRNEDIEKRIVTLLGRMTLEEKVGQVIQADIAFVTPQDVKNYNLGAILNGGNSAPGTDNRAPASAWLALADQYWSASTDTSDGGVGIPTLWGTDAVHGHNNILGATIFPHNIGLGAANDPDLMYEIGQVTALEMLVTGLDWNFAPTIAVVRDDRWGRTYESYSEDPKLVKRYAEKLVRGIQGVVGTQEFLNENHLIATAKHFVGDGGTVDGKDQGDNISTEEELRDIQGAAYPVAIKEGVQVVMASFNSWHGRKMHAYKPLLTDVLVGQMGFDGFVVGDWNGHGQVAGCSNVSCAKAFNNGLDMFMAPDSWKLLYTNILKQVKSNDISLNRLNQAVARILRVKLTAGLFERGIPSKRKHAGNYDLLASDKHKSIARKAVRKSLVLLKNENKLLPLAPSMNVLIAGDGANNIGKQTGGWTLSWQGKGNENKHFPQGISISQAIKNTVLAAGGSANTSLNGNYKQKPDVAVIVFGEEPYAEFQGDRAHLDFQSEHALSLLRKYKSQGIATVSIFLSGRAMWVNPELNASDAFVAAWLPGTEATGIVDVLFQKIEGGVNYDFNGKLTFSWPRTAIQTAVNIGDSNYNPLFPYGYGLTYKSNKTVGQLSEDSGLVTSGSSLNETFFNAGYPVSPWRLVISDINGVVQINTVNAVSPTGSLTVSAVDYKAQEDSRLFVWNGQALLSIEGEFIDLSNSSNENMALKIEYQVTGNTIGNTSLNIGCDSTSDCAGSLAIGNHLTKNLNKGWQVDQFELNCFTMSAKENKNIEKILEIDSKGPLNLQVASITLISQSENKDCSLLD